jgi:hypothetical protein
VGNAAYLYLSVSFIQMLKALMPVAVFSVGCAFGTDKYNWPTMANMLLVTVGVAVASYGACTLRHHHPPSCLFLPCLWLPLPDCILR